MEKITKAVAAFEVIKKLKQIQTICFLAVFSAIIHGFFNNIILTGGLALIVFSLIYMNSVKEEKELKQKYDL